MPKNQQGVWRIEVVSPELPLAVGQFQAAFCRSVMLNDKGNSDAV